jgi:hypothetical protein
MQLEHGLAGGWAIIQAQVESVRRRAQFLVQVRFRPIDPNKEASLLGRGEFVEPGNRAPGDNQGVPWRNWEFIAYDCEEGVQAQQPVWFNFPESWEHQFLRAKEKGR